MSSKKSSTSKVSIAATKGTKKSYYDEWRPPPGVRYKLSQTNIDIDAVVPTVKLEYTTVEYEPGQDLTVPVVEVPEKYARPRGRGPVFVFQEEIEEAKRLQIQEEILKTVLKNCKRRKKQERLLITGAHDALMIQIGPKWFHECSPKQMQSADRLKEAMMKDIKRGTINCTQETLSDMGIVYWPNHTKIEYALKKFYKCPVEFLLTIYRLNRPKEEGAEEEYTLNDRIILSCVVHLTMRETLRELHLRIPSPPRNTDIPPPPVPKPDKRHAKNQWKKVKWYKGMSPYLRPLVHEEQFHKVGVYKNRHKEYASLEYFDYIEDMYNVFYEDDPESIKKRKQLKNMRKTRWTKPPRIPVRYIESKMLKKQVCQLKRPSPYISPCQKLKSLAPGTETEHEPEPVVEEPVNNICCCSPDTFNENTAFDLKIKITTDEDEYHLTQKLCPYSTKNAIGDLKLVGQKKVEKNEDVCCEDEFVEGQTGKPFKNIEYTCECCTCGKSVNIFPEEPSVGTRNITNLKQVLTCPGCLDTIPEVNEDDEAAGQEYEEIAMDYEQQISVSDICKCKTPSDDTQSSNIDDPYYLCTCKASSDSCTCCICHQMDKEFLQKIKRYNQAFNTDYQACVCACKCKKYLKPTCCNAMDVPCKYCFCERKREVMGEERMEGMEGEEIVVLGEDVKTVSKDPTPPHTEFEEPLTRPECKCEKLYGKYLNAHDSCMSLFANYQRKIESDVTEYLRDINQNRCLCGDSLSSIMEEREDDEEAHATVVGVETASKDPTPPHTEFEEPLSRPECKCEKLYGKYLNAHDSCMSLFANYQRKIESDVTEYLRDINQNRCLCGDSLSSIMEEREDDEEYEFIRGLQPTKGEGSTDSECVCHKGKGGICSCCTDNTDDFYSGCTCNQTGVALLGCTCTNASSSSSSSDSSDTPPCACTCGQGPCKCEEFLLRVQQEKARLQAEREAMDTRRRTLEDEDVSDEQDAAEAEERDPRILGYFPVEHRDQNAIFRTALAALAEDGYPLAKLPEVHRLPHFQVWLNLRSRAYVSMDDREGLYETSKSYWNHIETCHRITDPMHCPISQEAVHNVNWGGVNMYRDMISIVKTDYYRRLKRDYIDQAQELFPSMCHYELPNKTFREVYFSYLPADENHIFAFKPWQIHERKNMTTRKPC